MISSAENSEAQVPSIVDAFNLENPPSEFTPHPTPLWKMFLVASIAVGILFGWSQQVFLLYSYIRMLNLSHTSWIIIFASGLISRGLVQPVVGYYSDRCNSPYGRRRPFIVAGVGLTVFAFFLIGYAADFGNSSKDPYHTTPNFGYFVSGFFILEVASNMLQISCRALLVDMAAKDHVKIHIANAFFSFFMAIGNILGYVVGSYNKVYLIFPFSETAACDVKCANFKSCAIISIALLIALVNIALFFVTENTFITSAEEENREHRNLAKRVKQLFLNALQGLSWPMWILLLVTLLNWIAFHTFFLDATHWVGTEIYGKIRQPEYERGVRFAILTKFIFMFIVSSMLSLVIEPLRYWIGGANRLWGIGSLWLTVCLVVAVMVTKMAQHQRHEALLGGAVAVPMPSITVKACTIALFLLMGVPYAITRTIPFALASIYSVSSGVGQVLKHKKPVPTSSKLPRSGVSIYSVEGRLSGRIEGGAYGFRRETCPNVELWFAAQRRAKDIRLQSRRWTPNVLLSSPRPS